MGQRLQASSEMDLHQKSCLHGQNKAIQIQKHQCLYCSPDAKTSMFAVKPDDIFTGQHPGVFGHYF